MIKFSTQHWGSHKSNAEEHGYKSIVISGPIQGEEGVRFGRLIQVRKKSGAFGSDTILIREADGNLHSFHNMSFFSVAEEFLPLYEEAMKKVIEEDYDNVSIAYSIKNKKPAAGFVVEGLDDINDEVYSMSITTEKEGDTTKITIR